MNAVPHRRRSAGRPQSRRGFTLIEVLLVAGILVMLAAIVVPNLLGAEEQSKIRTTKANVLSLSHMCDQYKATYDVDYPANLAALTDSPNIPGFKAIAESATHVDAWGQPFNFEYPTQKTKTGKPAIWSNGPDKTSGTADDIQSWTTTR